MEATSVVCNRFLFKNNTVTFENMKLHFYTS